MAGGLRPVRDLPQPGRSNRAEGAPGARVDTRTGRALWGCRPPDRRCERRARILPAAPTTPRVDVLTGLLPSPTVPPGALDRRVDPRSACLLGCNARRM